MTVIKFRVPIYFITVLLLSSWISLILSTHATPNPLRSPRRLPIFSALQSKELFRNNKNTDILDEDNSVDKSAKGASGVNEKEQRILASVVGIGVDQIINAMTAVGNVINARSNIDSVDRFMTAFVNLFTSAGGGSTLFTFYYIVQNFWVVFDATAMLFRIWEDRLTERRDNVEALQTAQTSNSAVEETLAALSEANAQLVLLKDGLNNLIRRKDIRRKGLTALKNQINIDSGFDETDDNNEEAEEVEEKEPTDDASDSQEEGVFL